ncbi:MULTISPECIES: multifunctional oxoglutarate decarboxylase/oxoglutarate dehydrogenase thiamine pyrophosphate-binding subunit/dihydrolipoyllysine-residue succinyltransferase subunit [unclassified Curtobacterium]|uniref:multifunctional oxoglutarate decarboxylase/oxoglutarate dehydrogenase thiamine pyrophosphate-binding subunit/dihydrolipoyllysine-residue succinyltransferase subunit n=1 Tax=unclassified Curtobacterium TaxID=257496 RepID=UPI000DA7193C|nr:MULTISPECIES: multifunctional oxoglutarate decarboxylase/oxoglutarate dehydrogenase thiamine pyrophosphate-binding subunit/dihydrolipoyllysine-residue succinyltransferase subunit [unclassified Curtobacterium]PZE28921.1 multifunctional oxoglutarate decarboxylase/oxoglutarate dehydrogenase thiamine pyrophosphate-binding subunit/dihydrolipoyllysine-residue succinyltransferase subunit [Curtobacterium sp. MCBD17_028]WIE53396.1 multifunctional oxoglutarate decarboxylase/oxoglutarate dehydrogenase th
MSSHLTGTSDETAGEFGANEWLVDELYEQFLVDRDAVDRSWWPVLESYHRTQVSDAGASDDRPGGPSPAAGSAPDPAGPVEPAAPVAQPARAADGGAPRTSSTQMPARTTSKQPTPAPIPADPSDERDDHEETHEDVRTPLRGMAKTLAANMEASLQVPTATSVRTIPAKLMIDNRIVINNHLRRTRGGKVSFTHLIGWALVKAIQEFPSQNVYHDEQDGKPVVVTPAHVGLGIAIDVPKSDGTRALLVPSIKRAETLTFSQFIAAYEDLVKRARANKLTAEDFAGTTISLTNPGGIGTVHSVPRLMKGQGSIIGAGALEYPAQFQGSAPKTLVELGVGKTITLTSTYDHRVIQGAGSGEFLKTVHELLIGERGFYEGIFAALRIPYKPIRWANDINVDLSSRVNKTARVQELINSFRVRGHLMADIDPLEYQQRTHPDLEIENHGLTFWDLDREFVTGGLAGTTSAPLRDILGILRDSYCRTIGVEYMHIQDPAQRRWMQDHVEVPYAKPGKDEQLRILGKLNEAEAFETFLQTKYVGQKRFSLEGSESMIAFLDTLIQESAREGLDEVAIGMAHRGRLNVLTNIAGKTYGQIFREFEGTQLPGAVAGQGSGDVKYHVGTEGVFRSAEGTAIPVTIAANPSHLEAVDGVLEGIVRGKQDRTPIGTFGVLPVLVHGDAAMAGQGVVVETLQLSQLRGYRTGGTVHVVVNNQVGFTTSPSASRSSVYSTDVAKTIQAPVFHVNGDDPEAVARVAEIAFAYRQQFHRDVVIDLVSYRRRGHNEGDDPSMTQPLMYNLIEAKRSVRTLYTDALVGRGDITQDEYDQAHRDFQDRLERAFAETHEAQTGSIPVVPADGGAVQGLERPSAQRDDSEHEVHETAVSADVLRLVGDAHDNHPAGFTVHPKLQQLLTKRVDMSRSGGIDWAFAELAAIGSLLVEGKPVRLTGQDTRRGTFVQRQAVFHDRVNGQEWLPLANLTEDQGRLYIYDSPLSEYAAMAFEYGYSVERPEALVMWEAQFGDFANGAQTVIDEFISSAEQKWGQRSGLVLLLPHGYEGQGPDHSSARIERYLQLCAEDNMVVARPSTPASYFHLLRRQAHARPQKPLVVFTPKAMLRMRQATSAVEEFTTGGFREVIDDQRIADRQAVRRVVLHSGKIHHDLAAEVAKRGVEDVALVRLEQLAPLPLDQILATLRSYPQADLVWAQEEPENQGAWPFVCMALSRHLDGRPLSVSSRPASAAPATGSSKRSASEAAEVIDRALTI